MGTNPDDPFLENFDLIEKVIEFVSKRRLLSPQEREDFASYAHLKLMGNDRAIIRKHRGESSLRTYLVVVVNRLFQDYRIQKWGKWRNSTAAKRIDGEGPPGSGNVAQKLEELVYRDGYSFHQACEILRTNHGVRLSKEKLAEIFARLPERTKRRFEGTEGLESVPASGDDGEEALLREERNRALRRALRVLESCMAELEAEDRLLVKMRYEDGIKVVNIAKVLKKEAKKLYRRYKRIERLLRKCLEGQGVNFPWGEKDG